MKGFSRSHKSCVLKLLQNTILTFSLFFLWVSATLAENISVSLTVPTRHQISSVDNLNFGIYSGSGNLSQSEDVCIYNNTENGHYDIKIKGNGVDNPFTVTNGSDTIKYKVYWQDASQKQEVTALNNTLSGRTGASSSQTCNSGTNASFEVEFQKTDLMKAQSGNYSGTLTLMLMAPSS